MKIGLITDQYFSNPCSVRYETTLAHICGISESMKKYNGDRIPHQKATNTRFRKRKDLGNEN